MFVLTVLALVYINMQMQIFDLAYKAKKNEKEVRKILDENGNIVYGILTLQSANHLGEKLLTESSNLKFKEKDKIVKLETKRKLKRKTLPRMSSNKFQEKANMLLSYFSLKSQAEAKPID